MSSNLVLYKNSSIEYIRFPGGPQQLLCFHGYGESATTFAALAAALQETYSIIAINLPWHGSTEWREGMHFDITDLIAIIDLIPGMEPVFAVGGYSMGGRVALHLYQHLHRRINRLVLMAPDGLTINGWYRLATQSRIGNRLFRYCMQKPGFFFLATGWLRKAGLINTGVYNFTRQFLLQETARNQLYAIWTTLRGIRPDIPLIIRLLQQCGTPVTMIYGEYDKVIRYNTGEDLAQKVGKNITVHLLPVGHKLLQQKAINQLANIILNPEE